MATRKRHGRDYWEQHLERWRKSGQTQVQYCASAGVCMKTFSRWKSLLSNTQARRAPATPTTAEKVSLIPVRLARPESPGSCLDGIRDIRIRLEAKQWIVEVPQGIDSTHLAMVLKTVAEASQ